MKKECDLECLVDQLRRIDWLDSKFDKTNECIGLGPKGAVFDQRHKIYESLKTGILKQNPKLRELYEATRALSFEATKEYIKELGITQEDE